MADGGYNAKVDCWCCGCIVYELLAGAPPFSAKPEDVPDPNPSPNPNPNLT